MPTQITKRGKKRYKGVVKHKIMGVKEKLFKDNSRESQQLCLNWEIETRKEMDKAAKNLATHMEYLTIYDWSLKYLDHCKANFSDKTYDEKTYGFRLFAKHVKNPNLSVEDIDPPVAYDFLSTLFKSKSGHATNKVRKNMITAWEWGSKFINGFPKLQENPFQLVDKFPEKKTPRYVPPMEDFWATHDACFDSKDKKIVCIQDQTILTTYLNTAARRGEIWRLEIPDINFHDKSIRLSTKKRGNGNFEYDILPMTDELVIALKKWVRIRKKLKDVKDSKHVFIDLSKFSKKTYGRPFKERRHLMERLCKRANVKQFGLHGIRHRAATTLYWEGHKIAVIQAMLRHKSKATTENYLKDLGLGELRKELIGVFKRPQEDNFGKKLTGVFKRPEKSDSKSNKTEVVESEEEPLDLVEQFEKQAV